MAGEKNVIERDVAVELTSDQLSKTMPNVVRAFTVRINDIIKSPGIALEIYAERLELGPNAAIDTSGGEPLQDATPGVKKGVPKEPGMPGLNGDPGGSGQKAGDVRIYAMTINGQLVIRANGGRGGRGQDGGDGATGARGADRISQYNNENPNIQGGEGGRGGDGGAAGMSGRGGDGGSIEIKTAVSLDEGSITTSAVGGAGGPAAESGKPGVGGEGGRGEAWGRWVYLPGGWRSEDRQPSWRHEDFGPYGPRGADGQERPSGIAGENGVNGVQLIQSGLTRSELAPGTGELYLRTILREAERMFLNDSRNEAYGFAVYVSAVARARAAEVKP